MIEWSPTAIRVCPLHVDTSRPLRAKTGHCRERWRTGQIGLLAAVLGRSGTERICARCGHSWASAQASPPTSAASQETRIVPTVMRQDELQPKSRGARVGALKERWDPFSRRRVGATRFRRARRLSARGRWLVKRPPPSPSTHPRPYGVDRLTEFCANCRAATFNRARIARTPKLFVRLRPSALRPHCRSDRAKP
jgi:hypothetical protein